MKAALVIVLGVVSVMLSSCQTARMLDADEYGYIRCGMTRKEVIAAVGPSTETVDRGDGWEDRQGFFIDRIRTFERASGIRVGRYDFIDSKIKRHENTKYPYMTQFVDYDVYYDDTDHVVGALSNLSTLGIGRGTICTLEMSDGDFRIARVVYYHNGIQVLQMLPEKYKSRPETVDAKRFENLTESGGFSYRVCTENSIDDLKFDAVAFKKPSKEEEAAAAQFAGPTKSEPKSDEPVLELRPGVEPVRKEK
jgi:hypothetical protein